MYKYIIFDTETTGLHIVTDNPFMIQYGLVDNNLNLVSKHVIDVKNKQDVDMFVQHFTNIDTVVGHNIKFDIHMLININVDMDIIKKKNYIDTSVLARLVIPHDTQIDKTFSKSLKKLAVKYLGKDSNMEEQALKKELSALVLQHKQGLKDFLVNKGVWINGNKTEETIRLNNIYNNWEKVYHTYSSKFKAIYKQYFKLYPAPTYADCTNVWKYGETDIDLTHGLFKLFYPKAVQLGQVPTIIRCSKVTIPLVLMEREGMTVDINKLLNDRNKLIQEQTNIVIIDPRDGVTKVSVGQHKVLKDIYSYEAGYEVAASDKDVRADILDVSPTAQKVEYLSKINKYISTYITRILKKLTPINNEYKIYTQYDMAGTVTGRLSGDFQQFPKEALKLNDGSLIDVRSWFIVPKDYKYMFYFDYSQMELRIQSEWSAIVTGYPDVNMTRAFQPYRTIEINGKHYLEEDPNTEWHPTDLHGLTTKKAFGIDESNPSWKHYRNLGKRCNFACNYGASAPKISSALKVDLKTAKALVAGYKDTFKGVIAFGNWISKKVYTSNYLTNLMGRRYYSRNTHLLKNWLVQGTGADILLDKLTAVYNYIEDKPHWRLLITVHDEIGLLCKDIPIDQLDKEVEDIKTILNHSFDHVDIISDVEYTTDTWSNKQDYIQGGL